MGDWQAGLLPDRGANRAGSSTRKEQGTKQGKQRPRAGIFEERWAAGELRSRLGHSDAVQRFDGAAKE